MTIDDLKTLLNSRSHVNNMGFVMSRELNDSLKKIVTVIEGVSSASSTSVYPKVIQMPVINYTIDTTNITNFISSSTAASGSVVFQIGFTYIQLSATVYQFVIYGNITNTLANSSGTAMAFNPTITGYIPDFQTEIQNYCPEVGTYLLEKYPKGYNQMFQSDDLGATDLSYFYFTLAKSSDGTSLNQFQIDSKTSLHANSTTTFHIPFTITTEN